MELPIALGKTISNETFVVDLAKMPHLLMAEQRVKVNL
jgi:S-DNA-T family DNA segregation ATPase FtsK/SpoIIIE